MTETINLNRLRKRRAKEAAELDAAVNRAAFGRTKAQKQAQGDARARLDRMLEGHRRPDAD